MMGKRYCASIYNSSEGSSCDNGAARFGRDVMKTQEQPIKQSAMVGKQEIRAFRKNRLRERIQA